MWSAYIIALIFCKENYCENSDNDENMSYIKTNIFEKIFIIEDIIKFLIIFVALLNYTINRINDCNALQYM